MEGFIIQKLFSIYHLKTRKISQNVLYDTNYERCFFMRKKVKVSIMKSLCVTICYILSLLTHKQISILKASVSPTVKKTAWFYLTQGLPNIDKSFFSYSSKKHIWKNRLEIILYF